MSEMQVLTRVKCGKCIEGFVGDMVGVVPCPHCEGTGYIETWRPISEVMK